MRILVTALLLLWPASQQPAPRSPATPIPSTHLQTRWAAQVKPDHVLPEYPRPQMARPKWTNLNGPWGYAITAADAPRPASFDGRILVPFPVESQLSGAGAWVAPDQRLWYRRTFAAPARGTADRVLLNFGAVDWEAAVYMNGALAGEHRGGYDPFTIDITNRLRGDGDQELVVAVRDATDDGQQPRGKQVRRPRGVVSVSVGTEGRAASGGRVSISVLDGARVIAQGEGPTAAIAIPSPHAWSPTDPFLYGIRVRLDSGDEVESYFGMRSIAVKSDTSGARRMFLNGKPLFQFGLLDQGWWPDGLYTAPTDEALAFDIQKTKELGFNVIRKHVKVEPARWYYHADRLGMLVWQDMPSGNNKGAEAEANFQRELKAVID